MNKFLFILLILAVCMSLTSGLLFSFSIAVSPGLKNLPDAEYIKAMKSINREIQNAIFFLSFFGPLILFPLSIYMFYAKSSINGLLIAGGIFYFIGILAITMFINVPLNEKLESFDLLNSSSKEISQMRTVFERPWTFWHNIRTVSGIASLVFTLIAIFKHKP